jgi:hypothetical protein
MSKRTVTPQGMEKTERGFTVNEPIDNTPELTWEQECRARWEKDDAYNARVETYNARVEDFRARIIAERDQERPWIWAMRVICAVECLTMLGILILLMLR